MKNNGYVCEIRLCHFGEIGNNICLVNSWIVNKCNATKSELLAAIYLNEEDYR